jgi:small nuclear ribonucleoprotein (snRNP)-like protein
MKMTTVKDYNGKLINYEAAVNLMDDDLREEIAASHDFDDDPQGFIKEYAKRHTDKFFGEDFAPYVGGAW